MLTSQTYETDNDDEQGKEAATDKIFNVTRVLKEMVNYSTSAYQTAKISNYLFRFLETLN